jgi:uncharacterized membrane protein YeaQ/YmgE (transglycosylase-associated protein family)
MTIETLLIWLIVGGIAGWLAGLIVRGGGFGIVGNVVVGIIGAFVGGWILSALGMVLVAGLLGTILSATIGAVLLLIVVRVLRSA